MTKEVLVTDKIKPAMEDVSLVDIQRSIEDLRELLAQAVSKLSRRLDTLESHVKAVSTLSSDEIEESVSALKMLIEESQRLALSDKDSATAGHSHIFPELQRQVAYLETQIARSTKDVKGRVDERHGQIKDKLDGHLKVMDRLFLDNQRYLNRLLFYLSVLLIGAVVLGNAFTQGSVDRSSNYIIKQIRAVSAEIRDITNQPANPNY
jgi:archaellum component FlaC